MPDPKAARVLLVDDDERLLNGCRRLLRQYDVTVTTSPEEAVELVADGQRFDVVVSD